METFNSEKVKKVKGHAVQGSFYKILRKENIKLENFVLNYLNLDLKLNVISVKG